MLLLSVMIAALDMSASNGGMNWLDCQRGLSCTQEKVMLQNQQQPPHDLHSTYNGRPSIY
jgi:hypothetical protein